MKNRNISLLLIFVVIGALIYWLLLNNKPASKSTITKTPLTKVRLAYISSNLFQLPLIVAEEKGYFNENGIEVKLDPLSERVPVQLNSNLDDIGITQNYGLLISAVQGGNLVWIGSILNNRNVVVVSDKPINRIKTLATTQNSYYDHLNKEVMKINKNLENVEILNIKSQPTRLESLAAGKVDAALVEETLWVAFQKKNNLTGSYKVIFNTSDYSDLFDPVVIGVRVDYLKTNQPAVESFYKSMIESISWIREHRKEAVGLFKKSSMGMSDEEAQIYVNSYIESSNNLQLVPNTTTAGKSLKFIESDVANYKKYDLDHYINLSVIKSLEKSGFLSKFSFTSSGK
ncbi:MAG: ABC transporter substrate-binding protein [Patescibacteria group bacterium]|nr:ABC transporter substrate-binding protein [Patescibacteria group bacterium]